MYARNDRDVNEWARTILLCGIIIIIIIAVVVTLKHTKSAINTKLTIEKSTNRTEMWWPKRMRALAID